MVFTPRRVVGVAVFAAAVAAPFWVPFGLRRIDRFSVQRVDVVGTRLLAPHEVLEASGITAGQNVWDSPHAWKAAIRRHPVVEDARITRRLPGTLVIRIRERRPAGLVDSGMLQLISVDGHVLPVDLSRVPVDLPLIRTRGLAASAARAVWAESGYLSQLDYVLWNRVSEVWPAAGGTLTLRIGNPRTDVMLPHHPSALQLRQLRSTLQYLARQPSPDSGAPARVDLRWEDQVVISAPAL